MSEMKFDNVSPGEYDVDKECYDYITIRIINVKPAEMQNLIKFVKAFCASPDTKDPSELNNAVRGVSELETTGVKKKRRNMMKTPSKTIHGDMIIGIKACLKGTTLSKGEIRNKLLPEGVRSQKEYMGFMSAFSDLKRKGEIIPDNPDDKYTLWRLKEGLG